MPPITHFDGPCFFDKLNELFPDQYFKMLLWAAIVKFDMAYLSDPNAKIDDCPFIFDFLSHEGVFVQRVPGDKAYSVSDKLNRNLISFRGSTAAEARARAIVNGFQRLR